VTKPAEKPSANMMEPSAKELIVAINQAVEDTPSLKSRFNANVEFCFDDDDVKERVNISKKTEREQDPPDLIVTTSLSVFHQLLNKKLTPQQAFMQGKLKIKGKVRHNSGRRGDNITLREIS
jgi:putative sterol carrier protein